MKSLLLALLVVAALLAAGCGSSSRDNTPAGTRTVTVALDWTPNTTHTGIYVAEKLGYYARAGIRLKVIPYASTAPETLIAAGRADVGFSYQAGVAYARAAGKDVVGVLAPAAKNTYAIGVKATNTAIRTPKDLSGKTYAGFGTPDERPELAYVIRRAGGTGAFKDITLNTSAYDAVYHGKADFTIPVVTWEGIQARLVGKPMKFFRFEDYGFPTQYASLLAASRRWLRAEPALARRFLAATQRGYVYAADHPDAAARILQRANPSVLQNPALVRASQEALAKDYMKDARGRVGYEDAGVWRAYGRFLYKNGLLVDGSGRPLRAEPDWSTYFTNAYLPAP